MINLTREEAQVPLVEQLESVPQDARLCIDDADGMGTHYFPIGNMCHEAAKAIRAKLSEPEPEMSLSQKLREAGYTKRDNRLECDECGEKFTRQMLPIHDCQPEPEPVAWMFPDDLERFQTSETFAQAFSIACGSPTQGKTIPLYTAPPQRKECQRCGEVNPAEIHTCTPQREW